MGLVLGMDGAESVSSDWAKRPCCLFVGCLTSQQHASVSQGRICSDKIYVLPHWDRSWRSNFISYPVTGYWHRANQSRRWPLWRQARGRVATGVPIWGHWYDATQSKKKKKKKKSRRKRKSNPRSAALEPDALTTRPTRQCEKASLSCSFCLSATERPPFWADSLWYILGLPLELEAAKKKTEQIHCFDQTDSRIAVYSM